MYRILLTCAAVVALPALVSPCENAPDERAALSLARPAERVRLEAAREETPPEAPPGDFVKIFVEVRRKRDAQRREGLRELRALREARMEASATEDYLFRRALSGDALESMASAP